MRSLFLFTFLFVVATPAFADGLFRPAFSYSIDKSGQQNPTTTTRQLIDIAGGYLTNDGWAIIGAYSMEDKKVDSGSSTTDYATNSYGAGFGWYSKKDMGPYIDALYYISSKMSTSGSTYNGSGWQVELGYKFLISGAVSFGAQLAYRNFSYNKLNGSSLNPAYTKTNLDPMFAIVVAF